MRIERNNKERDNEPNRWDKIRLIEMHKNTLRKIRARRLRRHKSDEVVEAHKKERENIEKNAIEAKIREDRVKNEKMIIYNKNLKTNEKEQKGVYIDERI